MIKAIRRDVIAIVAWVAISFGTLATIGATTSCKEPLTPQDKTVVNGLIDLGAAECVAEAGTLDEAFLVTFCHLTADVVHALVGARKTGAARFAKAQAQVRPLDDAGYP